MTTPSKRIQRPQASLSTSSSRDFALTHSSTQNPTKKGILETTIGCTVEHEKVKESKDNYYKKYQQLLCYIDIICKYIS
jgi:hypothetical protein